MVSAAAMFVVADWIGLPHCGQNIARSRTVTPQATQRRAISGSDIKAVTTFSRSGAAMQWKDGCHGAVAPRREKRSSDAMHRIEEIFSLRVDAHAEFLAFQPQSILQLCGAFAR